MCYYFECTLKYLFPFYRTHFQFSPPNPSASVSTTMATEDNHSTVSDKGDQGSSFEMNSKQDIAGTSTKLEAAGDTGQLVLLLL